MPVKGDESLFGFVSFTAVDFTTLLLAGTGNIVLTVRASVTSPIAFRKSFRFLTSRFRRHLLNNLASTSPVAPVFFKFSQICHHLSTRMTNLALSTGFFVEKSINGSTLGCGVTLLVVSLLQESPFTFPMPEGA